MDLDKMTPEELRAEIHAYLTGAGPNARFEDLDAAQAAREDRMLADLAAKLRGEAQ